MQCCRLRTVFLLGVLGVFCWLGVSVAALLMLTLTPAAAAPLAAKPAVAAAPRPVDVQMHVANGKLVLQRPDAAPLAAGRRSEPFHYVLPPGALDIPDNFAGAEDYFETVLLPRVSPNNGRQFIVDVGANTGQFAVAMVKAGVDGVSFEPGPPTCTKLKERIAEQGKERGSVRAVCAAVGAKNGSIFFDMPKKAQSTSFRKSDVATKDSVEVPVTTLDNEVSDGQSILLLKTDTQGFEMDVLSGAKRLLQNKVPRLLLVELSHYLLTKAGSSPVQVMELIAQYGYVCTHLDFHGVVREGKSGREFGVLPTPDQFRRPLAFSELASLLERYPPDGYPGWTDLLCW